MSDFKEKVFTEDLKKYGLKLLDDPAHNTTGAIRMFAAIRDKCKKDNLKNSDYVISLCAEGAWMAQRMVTKIKEYDPDYEDFTDFTESYKALSPNTQGYRTICHVTSLIGSKEKTLIPLCLKTLRITKSYHHKLTTHNLKYDGRGVSGSNRTNFEGSLWEKEK